MATLVAAEAARGFNSVRKRHPKGTVGWLAGGIVAAGVLLESCHNSSTTTISKPGFGELDYVHLTKMTISDAAFGGKVKNLQVKRNEKSTASSIGSRIITFGQSGDALDSTYTLNMSPAVACRVNINLSALMRTNQKGLPVNKDGQVIVPIKVSPDKSSDVKLDCWITNPADVHAHANSNMMAKATDGLTGIVNMFPEVNLDNPINRNAPMIGIGELQALNNFSNMCGQTALRILTDTRKPDNIQNDIRNQLFNDAFSQLRKQDSHVKSVTDTTLSRAAIDFQFNQSPGGIYSNYSEVLHKVEHDVHGLSFPPTAKMPSCENHVQAIGHP